MVSLKMWCISVGPSSSVCFCWGFLCFASPNNSSTVVEVVLFCAQRQYKLYLSCMPCLFHVLHAMPWCHDAMSLCLPILVIGSLASCCLLGGWGGSRPCEQAAASLPVLWIFPPALPGFESGGGGVGAHLKLSCCRPPPCCLVLLLGYAK